MRAAGGGSGRVEQTQLAPTALVTGGSRGIGRGICRALAQRGFALAVNYQRDRAAAEATCAEALAQGAPAATPLAADLADLDSGGQLLQAVLDQFGRLDLLVNNAGIAPSVRRDLLETTPASWDQVLAVNLRGPFFLAQKAAAAMIQLRRQDPTATPRIVFITSVSSTLASVNRGEYCVSKAGLSMVAKLFALRLAGQGVDVYEVRPGLIETDMTQPVHEAYEARIQSGLVPAGRWGTPDDVGQAVATLATGHIPYASGAILTIDGGLHLERL